MKKQHEVRYIVTAVASIPVFKVFSKTDMYTQAVKPGWGVVDWDGTGKEKALVCDEDCNADIYTKDGGYFVISPYEEINRKDIPKQADAEAIVTSDSDGYSFWTKGQIRIFVTYEESGVVDTFRIEYGADVQPYDGETELAFEDLYKPEGPEWDLSYRAEIPGTVEYQHKQEAAATAAEAGATWMDEMWEAGAQAKEIADKLEAPLSSIYSELRRGQDGSRLQNRRLRYNADLAQLRIQQSFERRGRRTGERQGQAANE